MAFQPTKKQSEVLEIRNKNIAVSASAGSGKTSIMIEKIANLICDEKIPIKNMLIVTFTNSASAEMKERLANKLEEKLKSEEDLKTKQFLIRQTEDLDNANICTIDKFCINILKKYYYLLELDGNFEIIDDLENEKIKLRAFEMVIKELNNENPEIVQKICDAFLENRKLDNLRELANKILEHLYVQENREKYLNEDVFRLYEKKIEESDYYLSFVEKIKRASNEVKSKLEILNTLNAEFPKVQADINLVLNFISKFNSASNLQKHSIISNFSFPTLGNKKAENKTEINECFNILKSSILKYKEIFSENSTLEQLQSELNSSKITISYLVEFVKKYDKILINLKKEINSYSFSDVEYFAYSILKREDVKDVLKSEIEIICVDEYQDVNKLQEFLIEKIARKNNLFLVGDIKQSIYGFRLSEPKYFQEKIENYALEENELSEQKNLNENFRSDKNILDYVNTIFCKFMTKELSGIDYEATSQLEGKNDFENSQNYPKVSIEIALEPKEEKIENKLYSVMEDEANIQLKPAIELESDLIVNKILDLVKLKIQNKDKVFEEVQFKDIAVLFRRKGLLYETVGKKLQDLKIPVCLNIKEDIYESLETRFLSHFLNLIISPINDISLSSVLAFPCLNISNEELLRISTFDGENEKSFSLKVLDYAKQNKDNLANKINDLFEFLNYLKIFAISHSVYEIYCEIIKKYSLENFLLSLPNGKIYLSNLKRVLSTVAKSNLTKVSEYVNFLKTKSSIKKEMSVGGEENSIQLMSIHASKGLEFKCVILAESALEMARNRPAPLMMSEFGIGADYLNIENKTKKPTVIKNYLKFLEKEKTIEEEKRLLYVALTRPKNILVITGIKAENQFEKPEKYLEKEPNSYLDLMLHSLNKFEFLSLLKNKKINLNSMQTSIKFVEQNASSITEELNEKTTSPNILLNQKLSEFLKFDYAFQNATNVSAKSSVSHYLAESNDGVSYNLEPQKLEISEHLSGKSSAEIGTAYHKCFELLDYSKEVQEEDVNKVLEKMKNLGFDTSEIRVNKILDGVQKLRKIMPQNAHIKKEQAFIMSIPHNQITDSDVKDEVLVQGVVDLMFVTENQIILVDFKNTNIKNANVLKQKYAKQLELYALAIKLSFGVEKVSSYIYSIQNAELIEMN